MGIDWDFEFDLSGNDTDEYSGDSVAVIDSDGGSTDAASGRVEAVKTSPAVPAIAPEVAGVQKTSNSFLYIDIETVPDYDRQHLFGLPPLPIVPDEIPEENLLPPDQFLSQTLGEIDAWFAKNNPCDSWLEKIEAAERAASGKKGNRKGLFDHVKKAREARNATVDAERANRKKMATTPEMCKIVALGIAIDDSPVTPLVVGVDGITEIKILQAFWSYAKACEMIVGFNVGQFDLPALLVRSLLLDVPASVKIDLAPHRGRVCDLMISRFGRIPERGMSLKSLAKMYGIEIPAEGVDGSQVEQLWQENPQAVGSYVASDIIVTRRLHRAYSGYFC